MDDEVDVSEVIAAVERTRKGYARQLPAGVANGREAQRHSTAESCRAKAASLRRIAADNYRPETRAKILRMADEWDARAAALADGSAG